MKKVYLIGFESEHYTPFIANELWNYLGEYKTRKEATKRMVELTHFFKKRFADEINMEKENGNTLSVGLYCYFYDETKGFSWGLIKYDLVDSRYLCGRYQNENKIHYC